MPLVTLDADGTGRVELRIDLERLDRDSDRLMVAAESSATESRRHGAGGAATASLVLEVPRCPVWWPVGYGEQPLAEPHLTLFAADRGTRSVAAEDRLPHRRTGHRPDETAPPSRSASTAGPVFVKGANWIPDDHFLTRITRERLARRLDQAVDANLNLIRVWGGGIYETRGLLRPATSAACWSGRTSCWPARPTPRRSRSAEEIEAEARENVARLAPHPSLVLWNGGNENLWGYEDWGWQERLDGRTWGARYSHELLPGDRRRARPDPAVRDGSPYSPARDCRACHPNDPDHGTHHQWEVWNRVDYTRLPRRDPPVLLGVRLPGARRPGAR